MSKRVHKDFIKCLPVELSWKIFSFIPVSNFCNCNLVCGGWHRFLQSDFYWHALLTSELGVLLDQCDISNVKSALQIKFKCEESHGAPIISLYTIPYSLKEKVKQGRAIEVRNSDGRSYVIVNLRRLESSRIFLPFNINNRKAPDIDAAVILVDPNFKEIARIKQSCVLIPELIVDNYQQAEFAIYRQELCFQWMLPSQCRLTFKKLELFKASIEGEIADVCRLSSLFKENANFLEKAFVFAAIACNSNVVEYLISEGARINAADSEGNTAIMNAIKTNYYATWKMRLLTLRTLVDSGADLKLTNENGDTLLQMAAFEARTKHHERKAILKFLVENGADINQRNAIGESLLFTCIRRKRLREMDFTVSALKADVNLRNHAGETPLTVASEISFKGGIDLLLKSGAKS